MKHFNITGVCVPDKHYMVDISEKLRKIETFIERGDYFTMNRARQYGKTTTLDLLSKRLISKYIIIKTSFEGIGDEIFLNEKNFCSRILKLFSRDMKYDFPQEAIRLEKISENITSLDEVSEVLTTFISGEKKDVILMIDEVYKSSNNQLFLSFLGVLRNKYLKMQEGRAASFHSVILAGVHDVKNLKLKLRPDEERKYNSPWNIAAEFDIDMSFNPSEISTMLVSYESEYNTGMDINRISEEIYNFTGGYPFLVSRICKVIDEKLDKKWTIEGIQDAVKLILDEKNTLFDDLIKNLENNNALYQLIYEMLVGGRRIQFNIDNPLIYMGLMYGILAKKGSTVHTSNRIFEIRIYNYMISKRSTERGELVSYQYRSQYEVNGKLNMELVLSKFQEIMHDEFRDKDQKFIEREGRLLFLCFLKPIINGAGFYFVEPETRMDNRMDVIIDFGNELHIVELKIWHGDNYEKNAIEQLSGYLDSKRLDKGYLISFSFNKNKEYTKKWKHNGSKDIFAVVV